MTVLRRLSPKIMEAPQRRFVGRITSTLNIIVLLTAFSWRAAYNLQHIQYRSANFVFFWLAGRMMVAGENPYDSAAWLAQHDVNAISWRPNAIFPYPLSLAPLLTPLGLLPLGSAYLGWQLVSLILVAGTVWFLLRTAGDLRGLRILTPLILLLMFFGPVYLSVQIGALGAFTLLAVTASILALTHEKWIIAGILLSLTLLKPPQGLPILVLAAVWAIGRREWRILWGMAIGAVTLLALGLLVDSLWPLKFAVAGQKVMDRTLGFQSNAFGLAYNACAGRLDCMWWLGGGMAAAVLVICSVYIIRFRAKLTTWEVFNYIIPSAFFSTIYLWSYDQILYIVPIVWIVLALIRSTRGYGAALGFLVFLVATSLGSLVLQAQTGSDSASLATTLIVLGMLLRLGRRSAPDTMGTAVGIHG